MNRFRLIVQILSLCSPLLLSSCKKEIAQEFIPNTGQVQVLNGCGILGAAEATRNHLQDFGFDVIEFGNAKGWHYPRTMVIQRMANSEIALDLAKVMGSKAVLHLTEPTGLVEATIIIGKDFEELRRTWQKPIH